MPRRQYTLNPIVDDVYRSPLFQPQLQNHFELVIKLTRDLRGGSSEGAGAQDLPALRKYLNLAVTQFNLPNISTEPIQIPFGNMDVNIAGRTDYGGADSITCIDYIGADIERIIYNWQMMVTNPETGQQGWAYNYKTDATVVQYAPDGSSLSSWVLRGLWPSSVNYGSLDKSASDMKQIEITLAYDLAYKKFDHTTGREGALLAGDDAKSPASMAAKNMAWKAPGEYEQFYGENSGLNENNTTGPLSSASVGDGIE